MSKANGEIEIELSSDKNPDEIRIPMTIDTIPIKMPRIPPTKNNHWKCLHLETSFFETFSFL